MVPVSADDPAGALAQWRAAHPAATLAEIEAAVDRQLSAYRASLIMAAATGEGAAERPVCPACGQAMQQVGTRSRTLRTAHEGRLILTDPAWRCPACGAGLFPPE
jgi:YgiT-type zinc finger domain-containing protein